MSEARSVQVRLLAFLSWTVRELLIDAPSDSNSGSETVIATVPSHILIGLRDVAELSLNIEHARLARLALDIWDETDDELLSAEICTSVYDLLDHNIKHSSCGPLISLLQQFYPQPDVLLEANIFLLRLRVLTCHSELGTTPSPYPEPLHLKQLITTLYHCMFLRLPATYAALALDCLQQYHCEPPDCDSELGDATLQAWCLFSDTIVGQWKTLALFSTLLFGATLTMFQIPAITSNALLRVLTHAALLPVFMSLVYTAVLSIYFGSFVSMRLSTATTSTRRWAQEMKHACTVRTESRMWSVWFLVSLPLASTCWGVLFFITTMVFFVWPPSTVNDSPKEPIAARLFLSGMVLVGIVHLMLSVAHLRRVGRGHGSESVAIGFV
ncbi:hypothetical protein MIND_01102000 [Mycena indigotica]|uniref:Uncharacterized protein n=1 Tax=Mycena indigotica TaxID=2126181 RepID=A0A8H6VVL8_9AGAR|nr:uncharacterized protein MIND_01102000 [Mycena indigotica]KAF7295619.1 hypothetical protein MIND_01102000 [Mycena indigotica]